MKEQLFEGSKDLGWTLTTQTLNNFIRFVDLLKKWNKTYNLTAITDPEEIVARHLLDSLSIAKHIKGNYILDIGAGAGFPGVPCALVLPEKQFVLLDSNGKKTRFMTQAVGELGLTNVSVVQNRVEEYRPQGCFDTITARAFSSLETIITQTTHLVCPEGEILVMKGVYPSHELQEIQATATVLKLTVPGLNEDRHLVCIKGSSHG